MLHVCTLCDKKQSFLMLQQVVCMLTTDLLMIKIFGIPLWCQEIEEDYRNSRRKSPVLFGVESTANHRL